MNQTDIKAALMSEARELGRVEARSKSVEKAAQSLVREGKLVVGGTIGGAMVGAQKARWYGLVQLDNRMNTVTMPSPGKRGDYITIQGIQRPVTGHRQAMLAAGFLPRGEEVKIMRWDGTDWLSTERVLRGTLFPMSPR